MVFEFVEKTILDILDYNNGGIEKPLILSYIYQLLKAVTYLHENNILHRDIKPENLLVTRDGVLKLCDFGFARKIAQDPAPLTDYVATRWYRSPELVVSDYYGKPCDIWAIGCVMAELANHQPLFPGNDCIDQIHLNTQILGDLPDDVVALMKMNKEFRGVKIPKVKQPVTLQKKYKKYFGPEELDLLTGLLKLSPQKRLTARQALMHPCFAKLRKADESAETKVLNSSLDLTSTTHRTTNKQEDIDTSEKIHLQSSS